MDGTWCGGKVLDASNSKTGAMLDGIANGDTIRLFEFSSLNLTDDDAFLGGPSNESLGLIEVEVEPVRITDREPIFTSRQSLSEIKLHERSKKAVTQQIKLAEPERLAKPRGCIVTVPTGPDLVKFSFKYCPADVLRANGIMPAPQQLKRKASSEKVRAPTPDHYDEADAEEEKMLHEQLNVLEAKRLKTGKNVRVKDDPDMLVNLPKEREKKVKRENQPAFVQGEIIDLT